MLTKVCRVLSYLFTRGKLGFIHLIEGESVRSLHLTMPRNQVNKAGRARRMELTQQLRGTTRSGQQSSEIAKGTRTGRLGSSERYHCD